VKAQYGVDSLLDIFNSNLGVCELYNTFLDSFTKVAIKNSVLSEIITSNVRWFRLNQLEKPEDYPGSAQEFYWSNRREFFRQLKYAMNKQGNRIQALEFKSYEMSAFHKELSTQKTNRKNFTNKIILWLGSPIVMVQIG
jgi:hypothetical protein